MPLASAVMRLCARFILVPPPVSFRAAVRDRLVGGLLVVLLFAAGMPSMVQAQSTGKITGVVQDAVSGETLPGVSVYLEENQYLGTITDADGRYFLLSVPPGTYTVVMSYVGFATVRTADVQVFSGRTTTVDAEMREQVIQGEEVVVQADRPIVVRDRTTSVSFVDQETIEKLPVQEVGDVVRFQPGVVTGSDGQFHFRGGRSRETAYLIDGIPVQDVFNQGGGNTVDIEVQSVQELQVFTGTFDAEFGGAQSGVVSVTTRDPGQQLNGSLRVLAGGYYPGSNDTFIGGSTFEPLDTKDVTLTLSGPIIPQFDKLGFFFTGRFEDRTGALKGERRFTADDGFVIDVYRRWYRDVYQPDDTRLIALDTARTPGGEVIRGSDGQPLTFAHGDGAVVDMSWNRSWTLNPKLVFRPTSRSRLTYTALYNRDEGQGYANSRRYAPDYRTTGYSEALTHILTYKQAIGSKMVVNLRGSYKTADYEEYRFDSVDDPDIQYLSASDDVAGFSLGTTDNWEARNSEEQLIVSGDLTWQVNDRNELKTGFQFRNNTFVIEDLDRTWVYPDDTGRLFRNLAYPSAGNFPQFEDYLAVVRERVPILVPERLGCPEGPNGQPEPVNERCSAVVDDRFEQSPIEIAAYVQDKLEVDDRLVVKAGLRYELFDVREETLRDPRTPTDRIGRDDNFVSTDPKHYLSPRIGISYPISATGAFRVAYGHFVQMPAYREMFKNPIFGGINIGRLEGRTVGNPNLKPERTIKYEMGLQQQVTDFVGVDVNLFYKNIRNLLGTEILSTLDNVQYFRTINRDYGLVRGTTLSFVTRPIGLLLGSSLDVTYSDAKGSSSDPGDVANLVIAGRSGELGDLFVERQFIPLNWDQSLTLNLSANVGVPDNWSVGFISQLATGQPYTPEFLDPNLNFPDNEFDNSERKPLIVAFDLNAEKRFAVGGVRYGLRVQVNNVFNILNERFVHPISGRADQIVRLPVVQADRERVLDYVGLFTSAESDLNPHWFSPPREILFGFTVNF